jgi:hypothetical protein
MRPFSQDDSGFFGGKPRFFRYRYKLPGFPDIDPVHKISPENGVVKFFPFALFLGPLPKFLRQPAVVRLLPVPQRQTRLFRRFSQAGLDLFDAHRPPRKELFKGLPLLRGFRVEGKRPPLDLDLKIFSQFFNTPGNEVAPGSDVIGKDFQPRPGFHFFPQVGCTLLFNFILSLPRIPEESRVFGNKKPVLTEIGPVLTRSQLS